MGDIPLPKWPRGVLERTWTPPSKEADLDRWSWYSLLLVQDNEQIIDLSETQCPYL